MKIKNIEDKCIKISQQNQILILNNPCNKKMELLETKLIKNLGSKVNKCKLTLDEHIDQEKNRINILE